MSRTGFTRAGYTQPMAKHTETTTKSRPELTPAAIRRLRFDLSRPGFDQDQVVDTLHALADHITQLQQELALAREGR